MEKFKLPFVKRSVYDREIKNYQQVIDMISIS
jgi:hypothetical protein